MVANCHASQSRLDAPGTLHPVMIRGIERSPIFKDDQDRQDFISRMGMLAQETGTKILAWALRMEHDFRILGSGDFVAEIIREAEKKVRRYLRISEMKSRMDNAIQNMEGVGSKC